MRLLFLPCKSVVMILVSCVLLRFVYGASMLAAETDEELAYQSHQRGMHFCMKEEWTSCLANLRAACRLHPTVDYYWNDLGVAELQAGETIKAQKRFLKALKLNPSNEQASENLEEVKEIMGMESFDHAFKTFPQLQKLKEIRHVDASDPFLFSNLASLSPLQLDLLQEPFVVKRALQHWKWSIDKMTMDHLREMYGGTQIDYYPQNMIEPPVHPFYTTFKEALERLKNPIGPFLGADASEAGTYMQWNMAPGSADELFTHMGGALPSLFDIKNWTGRCFSNQTLVDAFHVKIRLRMVLVAEKDAGVFNHQDYLQGASFQLQVRGRKKWHLCSEEQNPWMYNGSVNGFYPDIEKYPLFQQAECYQVTAEPGDLVYYPQRYWHQTLNLDTPSISYAQMMVIPQNYKSVTKFLKHACEESSQPLVFCHEIKQCYHLWEEEFHHFDQQQQQHESELQHNQTHSEL